MSWRAPRNRTTLAASAVLLDVGHTLADHLTDQCDWQAAGKAAPTRAAGANPHRGCAANLAHVAQYHLTSVVLGALA